MGVIFSNREESLVEKAIASSVSGVTESSGAPSPRASATLEKPTSNGMLSSGHPPLINGDPSNTSVSGGSAATGGIILEAVNAVEGRAPRLKVFLSVEGRPRARLCRLYWRLRCLLADAHKYRRNTPRGLSESCDMT